MARTHTKLCSPNPSPYIFSAARRRDKSCPTLVELVAPSPPLRMHDVQLTATRVFKKRINKGKEPMKRRGSVPPQDTVATGSASWRRVEKPSSTRERSSQPEDTLSDLSSLTPSSTPPPSPTTPPAVTRARSPAPSRGGTLTSILRNKSVTLRKTASTSSASTARRVAVSLTRSASHSSNKSVSKGGRNDIMGDVQRRLEAVGGTVTRYGEQDGEPVFIKESRVTSTTEPEVITHFWESFTLTPLRQAPDLTSYPDLVEGDVYINIVMGEKPSVQLWLWKSDANGGEWQRAKEGDMREDGRRLTVTPKRKQPSWVSSHWGVKQLRKPKAH